MTYVGIDVAKDKHDCYIVNSDGEILADVFTISNDQIGFNLLFQTLQSVAPDLSKVKVGLEATGHYSYNILGFQWLCYACTDLWKMQKAGEPTG